MKRIEIPTEITEAMDRGAALAVSMSGGKDSQAMAIALVSWAKAEGYWGVNDIFAIHADLGRMEWTGEFATDPIVRKQAADLGLRLEIATRTDGRDLVDHIKARRDRLIEQERTSPFWPSAAARYCTSDLKRDPINKYLRKFPFVISAEGIRADESRARAKKPCWSERKSISTQSREALTWNPILEWNTEDVWSAIGTSGSELEDRQAFYREGSTDYALAGWLAHPAYVLGNERLSCALCILGSRGDLLNGARHNPDLFQELLEMEIESGFTFTQKISLVDLAEELAAEAAAIV